MSVFISKRKEKRERVELDHVWSAMRFVKGDENARDGEVAMSRKRESAAMAE